MSELSNKLKNLKTLTNEQVMQILKAVKISDDKKDARIKELEAENEKLREQINGETSDGYHTFNELYYHRLVLSRALFNILSPACIKSKLHDDGTMVEGYFIVGINTNKGWATYHYPISEWGSFVCKEVLMFPKWDGHDANEAIKRIDEFTKELLAKDKE